MAENISVFDCDGHIIESIPEMVPFLDPVDRDIALKPTRNRQGVFAGLDAIHYPRNIQKTGEVEEPRRPRVDASDHRKGSGEDWVEFLNKAGVSESVLFPSEGLSVGFFQQADYAVRICRAFNDYVSERYRKVDPRLYPMGLIAMQDVKQAVKELRRLVLDLKLPGAMLPSRGLPLHLGHDYYWPVYEEAANLGCALGIHGGSSLGLGADSFTDAWAARTLRHPVPLALEFVALVYHGVSTAIAICASAFSKADAPGFSCLKTGWTGTRAFTRPAPVNSEALTTISRAVKSWSAAKATSRSCLMLSSRWATNVFRTRRIIRMKSIWWQPSR